MRLWLIVGLVILSAGWLWAEEKNKTVATPAPWTHRPYPADEVNLIGMGDWGNGKDQQKKVAQSMIKYVKATGKQFNGWLSPGDCFYVKLKDSKDPEFNKVFEQMYDPAVINFPCYGVYGNHDYEGDKARIELEYAANHPEGRWKMPAPYYRVDLPAEKPLVTILMLNSNKPRMTRAQWDEQLHWMDQELGRSSGAVWKVACAHHPFFSNGAHGDNGVLQVEWGPIFRKHNLDIYICGHDHDLQQIQVAGWPMTFIVAGGGGQGTTDMRWDTRGPFSRKLYGFAHLNFTPKRVDVTYIAGDGRLVHHFVREKDGNLDVRMTTGHDKPTRHPLKAINGISETDQPAPVGK